MEPRPPPPGGEGTGGVEEPFYPASVVEYSHLSDHLPIFVSIPCQGRGSPPVRTQRIRVDNLTEEVWEERDREVGTRLRALLPEDVLNQPVVNIHRFCQKVTEAIRVTFREERQRPKLITDKDPFEHFLLMHIQHPEMDGLLAALENGDEQRSERYMCRISSDGWRKYLKSVN